MRKRGACEKGGAGTQRVQGDEGRAGDRYFYLYNDGTQPQHVLKWTNDLDDDGHVLRLHVGLAGLA